MWSFFMNINNSIELAVSNVLKNQILVLLREYRCISGKFCDDLYEC